MLWCVQGNAGALGGPRGHLWVELKVANHPQFKREGADIHLDVPIPVSTAVLGGTVTIPTLSGEVNLKIPAGTQPNEKQAMRGKGIKQLKRSSKGNLYVHFKVQIPKYVFEELLDLSFELHTVLSTSKSTLSF